MTTLIELRTAIVDLLNSIPNIGRVQPYQRFSINVGTLKQFYVWQPPGDPLPPQQIRGWYLHRPAKTEDCLGNQRFEITNTWHITGFMGIKDEEQSALVFDSLIEDISTALREQTAIYLLETTVSGFQLLSSQPVMFADILCHCAEIQFQTKHRLNSFTN